MTQVLASPWAFPDTNRVLVVGFRGEREVAELLKPLAGMFSHVIVTEADDSQAIPSAQVAAAVAEALGSEVTVEQSTPVAQAVTDALFIAGEDDMVVVTGSLYVVGDARSRLGVG